jgi:hypothetical protein
VTFASLARVKEAQNLWPLLNVTRDVTHTFSQPAF